MRITNRQLLLIWAIIAVIIAFSAPAKAQDEFCCFWSPKGRVKDVYGRSVQGKITLWGCKTPKCEDWVSWTTYSNSFGYFQFKNIPAQDYGIDVRSRSGNYNGIVGPMTTGFIEAVVRK